MIESITEFFTQPGFFALAFVPALVLALVFLFIQLFVNSRRESGQGLKKGGFSKISAGLAAIAAVLLVLSLLTPAILGLLIEIGLIQPDYEDPCSPFYMPGNGNNATNEENACFQA